MLKNVTYAFWVIICTLVPFSALYAIGSGGGGSVPSCSQDTWTCGNWNDCSASGSQTRVCQKTFDCETADTPKPVDQQSCTPPCTEDVWTCYDWSACSAQGLQSRACIKTNDCPTTDTPKPQETMPCTPPTAPQAPEPPPSVSAEQKNTPPSSCTKDEWTCGEWNACDPSGMQKRTCTKTTECPKVQTPMPSTIKACEKLQCGDKPTLRERVACRLSLESSGIAREYSIEYLPEECRTLTGGERQTCIAIYASYKPCWSVPVGEKRFSCAKQILGLAQPIQSQKTACDGKESNERLQCLATLQYKTHLMIKFRIYDLEERAEELVEDGANKETVADFVTFIQESKQRFNAATTKEERRQVILDVRTRWRQFVLTVKNQVK